ncbi:hypothetical protein PENTCL1PPCAC_18607, partial [Pristionchus entomophagus]
LHSNMWSRLLLLVLAAGIFQSKAESDTYENTKNAVNNAADNVAKAGNDAKATAQSVLDKGKETADGVGRAISDKAGEIGDAARGIGDSKPAQGVNDAVHQAGEKLSELGK